MDVTRSDKPKLVRWKRNEKTIPLHAGAENNKDKKSYAEFILRRRFSQTKTSFEILPAEISWKSTPVNAVRMNAKLTLCALYVCRKIGPE